MSEHTIEVCAQAVLRLTADLAERAADGPADTDDREERRRSFLQVRAHVERLARSETQRRPDAIGALMRIARISHADLDRACEEIVRAHEAVMVDVEALMKGLRRKRPPKFLAIERTTTGGATGGCTRFGPTDGSGRPRWSQCVDRDDTTWLPEIASGEQQSDPTGPRSTTPNGPRRDFGRTAEQSPEQAR